GKVRLGQVDLGAAHEGGDIAAAEVLRDDFFVDAPKDRSGVDIILGAIGLLLIGEGRYIGDYEAAIAAPGHAVAVPFFVAPLTSPATAARAWAKDDHQADKDEDPRRDKAVDMGVGVIVLDHEKAADHDQDQPGAAAEAMAEAEEDADGYEQHMPVE